MDDGRCAYARFCHQKRGTVWALLDRSDDPEIKEEVIQGSIDCPSGRLMVLDKDGDLIEPEFAPVIEVLEDRPERVSGPLYVKGNVPIVSADGSLYEVRNRVTLCRCGRSYNKPFCDATHLSIEFKNEPQIEFKKEPQNE